MITDDGCWADFRISADQAQGWPALFLDRDGVVIEDAGYPHRPQDILLIDETLRLVGEAKRLGFRVGIVSNQSGIGRGLFRWDAFHGVQAVIDAALRERGSGVDFVLACPHHPDATLPDYRREAHGWRKPAPGMILAAATTLGLDLGASVMLGDRGSDMEAARRAGVRHRWLLTTSADQQGTDERSRVIARSELCAEFQRSFSTIGSSTSVSSGTEARV